MGSASIVASGDSLYMLQGDYLYRLRPSNLSILAQRQIPTLVPPRAAAPTLSGAPSAPEPGAPLPGTRGETAPALPGTPPALDPGAPLPPAGGPVSDHPTLPARGGARRGRRAAMPGMLMPLGGPVPTGGATLTVSNRTVYLLRGNTVYRFRASDLTPLGQADLPARVAPIATQKATRPRENTPLPSPAPDGATPPPPGGQGTGGTPPAPTGPDLF